MSEHTPPLRSLALSALSHLGLCRNPAHNTMTESSDYEEDDTEDTDSSDAGNEISEHGVVVQLHSNGEWGYNIANTV